MGKPKIAFIGSSPIMCIYINKLCGDAECTIFEGGLLGGAWGETNIQGTFCPIANNIICPLTPHEEECIDSIEKYFVERNVSVLKYDAPINLMTNYIPEQYLLGRFFKAVQFTLNHQNVFLRKQWVKEIKVKESKVNIDGEVFDFVVIPSNHSLKDLWVKDSLCHLEYEKVVSEHIRVIFSNNIEADPYSENFDNAFDRGGIMPTLYNIFIGRVRRESKGSSVNELASKSIFLQKNKDKISFCEKNFYPNLRPKDGEINKLHMLFADCAALCVETRQFVKAFSEIPSSLELIRAKL